jgi:hypothetical protein
MRKIKPFRVPATESIHDNEKEKFGAVTGCVHIKVVA